MRVIGKHRAAEQRTLHLLDLENLVGGRVNRVTTTQAWRAYEIRVGIDRDDQVVVGAAGGPALDAFLAIPRTVQLLAPVPACDAVDQALLAAWPVNEVASRYDRVVIGSGDHIFTSYAAQLRLRGVKVDVATGVGRCSAALYRACQHHIALFGHPTPRAAA